ncbi:hypothetical protein QFC22_002397 [Naganishia vaughanmartiniae]|uniref:Uncharacterized protein n=1 Tax=Naganishia vaughanmartiniae TaxID=1424756 RepID=A0ACC2XDV7_9TREE|nr:hypothetical protein QFC22_002397 [Naganishia vaughanmartiniae]
MAHSDPGKDRIAKLVRQASLTGKLPDLPSRDREPLTYEQAARFAPAKVFKGHVKQPPIQPLDGSSPADDLPLREITSMCFDDTGHHCIMAGQDEFFTTFDMTTGKKEKYFASHKYGVDHITSTHHSGNVLHSSTKQTEVAPTATQKEKSERALQDNAVRYHSAHDNKYLKYFKGHTDKVCSISMSPVNSSFLTGSFDQTVLMWDLRTDKAMGKLTNMDGHCITAWDSTGTIFAVGTPRKQIISLYASNAYDKKPFAWATIDDPGLDRPGQSRPPIWMSSLEFSNNGKYLLVGCVTNVHYVLEAFTLQIVARLEGHQPMGFVTKGVTRSGAEVSWTPDSSYVLSGSGDGKICIWDLQPRGGQQDLVPPLQPLELGLRKAAPTLSPLQTMNQNKEGGESSRVVKFNPRLAMFASAGVDAALWLPRKEPPPGENEETDMS